MTKMVKVKVNGRWDIILPEHRAVRPEWTSEQGWEKARLDSMFKTTKKGDVVYYVGAEEGDMCALLQMWGAEVALFEPNPAVWPNVKAVYEANKLEPPIFSFYGFNANKTDLRGYTDKGREFPACANGDVISNHGFKNLCEDNGEIPLVKIDDVVYKTSLIPHMISVDVEGAEWEVLRGAEQTLIKYHPRIYLSLHPEFLYEIYKEYAFDLRNWLKNLGYKETLLDYQHEVHLLYEENK